MTRKDKYSLDPKDKIDQRVDVIADYTLMYERGQIIKLEAERSRLQFAPVKDWFRLKLINDLIHKFYERN